MWDWDYYFTHFHHVLIGDSGSMRPIAASPSRALSVVTSPPPFNWIRIK